MDLLDRVDLLLLLVVVVDSALEVLNDNALHKSTHSLTVRRARVR